MKRDDIAVLVLFKSSVGTFERIYIAEFRDGSVTVLIDKEIFIP